MELSALRDDLSEHLAVPVLLLDGSKRIIKMNRAARELVGRPPCEVLGRPFGELLASDWERWDASANRPAAFECLVHFQGGPRRVAWQFERVGSSTHVVAVCFDVTERTQREAALRESEERIRTLIHAMPDPAVLKDAEGRWQEVNPAGRELFELEEAEYRDQTDAQLAARRDFYQVAHLACADTDLRAWNEGGLRITEEFIPRPDGSVRVYESYKTPVFHPDGRRKGLAVLLRNVTDRKRAEDALRRSAEQLKQILETAPDAIFMLDADHRITFANSAAEALLGVPRSQLLARSIQDPAWKFGAPGGGPLASEHDPFQRLRQSRQPVVAIEIAVHRPDGLQRIASVSAAPLEVPRGSAVFVAHDVTRRAELERMKTTFIEIASHELKTPLTPLRLLLDETVAQLKAGKAVTEATLQGMTHQVMRVGRLVDQLLGVVRLERRDVWNDRKPVDMRRAVAHAVEGLRADLPERRIELDLPETAATVSGDEKALTEVVDNLLDNAIKYSSGDVEVHVNVDADAARVAVVDHGPGIASEQQVDLFSRFYRVQGDASIRQPGLGLGLFICQEIIRCHEGSIGYDTELGRGSTFYFTLPLLREPAAPSARAGSR